MCNLVQVIHFYLFKRRPDLHPEREDCMLKYKNAVSSPNQGLFAPGPHWGHSTWSCARLKFSVTSVGSSSISGGSYTNPQPPANEYWWQLAYLIGEPVRKFHQNTFRGLWATGRGESKFGHSHYFILVEIVTGGDNCHCLGLKNFRLHFKMWGDSRHYVQKWWWHVTIVI